MHEWLRTYTVGQQDIGYFPMAIFKAIGPVTVRFGLSSSQLGARTLEIGVTLAFAGSSLSLTHEILRTDSSLALIRWATAGSY